MVTVTKSKSFLGHGRLCAPGIPTGHCKGTWAIFMIRVKVRTQLLDAETVLQYVSLPLEGPFPQGGLWTWECWDCRHLQRAQVSLYCLNVFPPTVIHQLQLGRRECPSKTSCSSSKGRYHAGEEKGAGLPVKLGPGEQLFSRISPPSPRLWGLCSLFHSSHEGGSFWGGHPQSSRDQEPWSVSCPGSSRGSLPLS